MTHIKIGKRIFSKFSENPGIAVVVDSFLPIREIEGYRKRGANLLEIRFDLMDGPLDSALAYVKEVSEKTGMPLLGTLRENDLNRGERLSLFEQLIPFVDAVDIEIDADIASDVIGIADEYARTIIVSEHNYISMPDTKGLSAIVDTAVAMGADIVKIAALSSSFKETARLMNFALASEKPMVAIAMGEYGKISRMAGMQFGSLYTYAFVNAGVAPGQISFDELVTDIARYYPGFGVDQ